MSRLIAAGAECPVTRTGQDDFTLDGSGVAELPVPKLSDWPSVTWQPAVFPEGVYLSPDLTVLEEDENVSSLTLKLVRPLSKYFDLDVRYAGFLGFLPQNEFLYLRHMVSFGVAVNFP